MPMLPEVNWANITCLLPLRLTIPDITTQMAFQCSTTTEASDCNITRLQLPSGDSATSTCFSDRVTRIADRNFSRPPTGCALISSRTHQGPACGTTILIGNTERPLDVP